MVIFRHLGQNGLKLELLTFAVHKNTDETQKGRYQVNLQEKKNIIKIVASFPRQKL